MSNSVETNEASYKVSICLTRRVIIIHRYIKYLTNHIFRYSHLKTKCMVYGTLPEIISVKKDQRKEILKSYSTIYLEEEIRAARRRLAKTPKYYLFDIGVKNATADFPLEDNLVNTNS